MPLDKEVTVTDVELVVELRDTLRKIPELCQELRKRGYCSFGFDKLEIAGVVFLDKPLS
jgi:hypothetical protein